MKLEIYDEKKKEDKVVRLRLVRNRDYITLECVDENGDRVSDSSLIRLLCDGTISKYTDVNKELGFQLDHQGKIKEV